MHRTRIKICGLTRARDAAAAVGAGADALGVILAPSPRRVSASQAAEVLACAPPPVARVGVFVDPTLDEVLSAVEVAGLTAVQLSGAETPEFCARIPVPVIKTLGVGTDFGWSAAEPYRDVAAALLLDTYVTGKAGGTATTFDWHSLAGIPGGAPVFVAGGLTPDNVAECIRALSPFAVDVSSGVEASAGIKDHDRIRAFALAVRAADQEGAR